MLSKVQKLKQLELRMKELGQTDPSVVERYLQGVTVELSKPDITPGKLMSLFRGAFDTGRLYQLIGAKEFTGLLIHERKTNEKPTHLRAVSGNDPATHG